MWRFYLIILVACTCTANTAFTDSLPLRAKNIGSAVAVVSVQKSFHIEPLASGVFAAIAKPGGRATTNAMFIIGKEYVIAAGAHMSRSVLDDLYKAINARTRKPVRYFVLTHHHSGFNAVDFDFPPGQDVVMSWQTLKNMDIEVRQPEFTTLFFNDGLTLKPGGFSVVLTNIGKGHTDGDVSIYIPEADVLFASDLLYIESVGYMGNGYMTDWLMALDFLEQIGANQIIPGYGPVSTPDDIYTFSQFFREFLTEVLKHIEAGDSLETTLATFNLPKYDQLDGYDQILKHNIERAYNDLTETYKQE